jgi:hypothetical protein
VRFTKRNNHGIIIPGIHGGTESVAIKSVFKIQATRFSKRILMQKSSIVAVFATSGLLAAALCVMGQQAEAPASASTKERVTRTVEDGGTGDYKAILVSDSSLPTHTIYRPKDLSAFGDTNKLPILVWGNGACANSSRGFQNFLSEIASHGYLVVAIGPTVEEEDGKRGGGTGGGMGGTKSSQLTDAIDWAIAQNGNKESIYFGKLATSKVAAAGQSCGGLQALEVSSDPRIITTLVCNSGILNEGGGGPAGGPGAGGKKGGGMPGMPPLSKEHLTKLHGSVIYLLGGSSDIAYANGMDDFKRIEKLPVFAANYDVGHGGTYSRPHGGEFATVATGWLNWQLKDDKEAAKMFIGDYTLSKSDKWKVEKKNIP